MSSVTRFAIRHCTWDGFANARSLEGLPTRTGPIRSGRLFRSDLGECGLNQAASMLRAEGISRVLDLRSQFETHRRPSVLATHPSYRCSPLVDPRMDHLRDPSTEFSLADLYRGSIDRNGRTIAEAARILIHAPSGGVLMHCAAGKDRTGILIAVLLAALGAPTEMIVTDYTATEGRLERFFAEEIAHVDDPQRRERLISRQHASPETMTALLCHLDERHGGAASYLARHGLTDRDLKLLAARLTNSN